MKRTFRTLLVLCCLALCLTFCLTACSDKCEHSYDNACDVICNECGEERTITHDFTAADCDTPKTCSVCGATEGEALGHEWTTPDVDLCEVQSTCSRCGATDGENKEHSPETDDGDCTTEITCSICGSVTTPAKDSHTGGTATCVSGKLCEICGVEYDTTKNPNYHTSTEFTYNDNLDGTHTKAHKCCEVVENATEKHTFDANICICGAIQITDVNAPNDADHPFGDGWSNDEEEGLDSGASIGTQDVGKTAWVNEDQIIVTLISETIGTQTCVLTYNGVNWTLDGSFVYAEGETPTVTAVYAPSSTLGMGDYIPAFATINGNSISISFEDAIRNYSRLRIVGLANQTLIVTTTGFTPAGATSEATEEYTLTTDNNGNAFLYGTFAKGATVSVKHGDVVLKDYTFTAENNPNGTEQGKSYALDARPIIDGTLGGKTAATEEDIEALVEQLKAYVDNGITTIFVTGSNPATYSPGTAIGEAIYRLSNEESYNGKIDLILSDVTEIIGYEFQYAYALNSITLHKVTKLGYQAFNNCQYLQKITFGSVVTEGTPDAYDFQYVGTAVGGCYLVLNREQVNAATEYKPDLNDKRWWAGTQWNYIELI